MWFVRFVSTVYLPCHNTVTHTENVVLVWVYVEPANLKDWAKGSGDLLKYGVGFKLAAIFVVVETKTIKCNYHIWIWYPADLTVWAEKPPNMLYNIKYLWILNTKYAAISKRVNKLKNTTSSRLCGCSFIRFDWHQLTT